MPMLTLKSLIATVFLLNLAMGCTAPREHLMDFTYVSTSVKKIDAEGEGLGDVESDEICIGEDNLGLIGTAVDNALSKADGAAYLKDATVYTQGRCVVVDGTAHKKGKAGAAAVQEAEPANEAEPAVEAETPAAADGTVGGNCYGNGTCNEGLSCVDNACQAAAAAEAAPEG
jgi:hypothetical protein